MGVLVASLVFSLASPALAATLKSVELYYNDIKIRLNGEELIPKNANGEVVEPFIIEGTTYLPVRAIASALGLNVDFDWATQTVILGNDPEYNQPAAWLGDLEPFTGTANEGIVTNQQYTEYSTANNGDTFDRYWSFDYKNGSSGVSYLLKGQYTRLTGTFYLSSYSKNDDWVKRLLIYSDDNLIYTSPEVGKGVEPIDFDIDVSNCYKLTIICQEKSSRDGNWSNSYMTYTAGAWDNYKFYFYFYIGNAALWTD